MTLQTIKENTAEILVGIFAAWIAILFMIDIAGAVFGKKPSPEATPLPPIREEFKTKAIPNSKCTQIGDVEVCEA